jgi:hypothetical protein
MRGPKTVFVAAAAAALVAAGSAEASAVRRFVVTPSLVRPGALIRVSAAASPCSVGGQVILISRAFRGHAYGEGAIYGRVRSGGAFAVSTRIRANLTAGRYQVSARCAGGNLPVGAFFKVR